MSDCADPDKRALSEIIAKIQAKANSQRIATKRQFEQLEKILCETRKLRKEIEMIRLDLDLQVRGQA